MILSAQPLANIKISTKIPSDEQVKAYVDEAIQNVDRLIDMPQTFVSAITLNEEQKYTPVNGNINLSIEFKPSCDFNVNVQNAILCCLRNIAYIDDNGYNSYANLKSAMNRAKDIYTVTYDFNEHVSASTDAVSVQEGDSYDLSIAPITGKLKNFYYTMGGESKFVLADGLTYDTLNFSIQHVLDNLVIHATAEDIKYQIIQRLQHCTCSNSNVFIQNEDPYETYIYPEDEFYSIPIVSAHLSTEFNQNTSVDVIYSNNGAYLSVGNMCDHLTISAASIKEYERFDILSNMASSFALSTTYSNIVCPTGLGDRGYIYAETVMLSDFQHNTNSQYKFVFRADRYENDKSYTTTMTVIVKTVYATQVASVSLLFSANGINMGGTLSSCSGYSRAITEVAFKDRFEWQVNSSGVMLNGYTVCSSDFAANAVSSYYDVMIGHFRNNPITMTHMIPHVEYISQSDLREIRTVRKMG